MKEFSREKHEFRRLRVGFGGRRLLLLVRPPQIGAHRGDLPAFQWRTVRHHGVPGKLSAGQGLRDRSVPPPEHEPKPLQAPEEPQDHVPSAAHDREFLIRVHRETVHDEHHPQTDQRTLRDRQARRSRRTQAIAAGKRMGGWGGRGGQALGRLFRNTEKSSRTVPLRENG